MSQPEAPKIEFPCDNYPIKVLGESGMELHTFVHAVMSTHAYGYDHTLTRVNVTAKGNFQSLTVYITATGVAQLQAIHEDLRINKIVRMVL